MEIGVSRQLDVHAQTIRPAPLLQSDLRRIGNRFQVDVATVVMFGSQFLRDCDQLLHRVVGRLDDAGTEEQSFDVVALVEFHRQRDDFIDGEPSPRRVAGDSIDAVLAIVDAVVGQQNLQQRDASTIGRVAVTDSHALGAADLAARSRRLGTAARARRIVLCRIS